MNYLIVDNFAGGGGASLGIKQAVGRVDVPALLYHAEEQAKEIARLRGETIMLAEAAAIVA